MFENNQLWHFFHTAIDSTNAINDLKLDAPCQLSPSAIAVITLGMFCDFANAESCGLRWQDYDKDKTNFPSTTIFLNDMPRTSVRRYMTTSIIQKQKKGPRFG